jgi:heptosyltransferase-2
MPEWKGKRHEVFNYLHLIAVLEESILDSESVMVADPQLDLAVSESRRSEARTYLTMAGIEKAGRTVALGVGSANSRAKRWPALNYAKLNDFLQRELGANVVLLGAANEAEVSHEVYELSKYKPIDLTGKTNLDRATSMLSEVDLLISNDMGLAHIAPAVGTKTMVIFGPTDPEITRPYSPHARVIRRQVECSPCMLRDCPIDHRCMERITVEEVFEQARIILTNMPPKISS